MRLAISLAAATLVLALCGGAATAGSHGDTAESCDVRPVLGAFFAALKAGDSSQVEQLFAEQGEGWRWYSVSDRDGQRLGAASMRRASLEAYFAARIRQREELRLVRIRDGGNGNFGLLLERRADDLRGGRPVRRSGKGWVSCTTGKIGVWSLGGAPPPRSFGPCPMRTLALPTAGLGAASRAVLRFVRDIYSEMSPGLDVSGARVVSATPAPGNVKGYTARVKCGRAVQRRTAVVEVRFPRVAASERVSSIAFYASRKRGGWLIWRLII